MNTNVEKLTAVLTHWLKPTVTTIAQAKLKNNNLFALAENSIRKWLPVSENYSLTNDIAWAVTPIANSMLYPLVNEMVSKLPEESIPELIHNLVDTLQVEVNDKGIVSFLEIVDLEPSDVSTLKTLLDKNIPFEEVKPAYTIIE